MTVRGSGSPSGLLAPLAVLAMVLSACAGPPPAPVEERRVGSEQTRVPDNHHRVVRGDTLYGIAFRHGVDFRDLADWNDIAPGYTIYPGDVLRLVPRAGWRRTGEVTLNPVRRRQTPPPPPVADSAETSSAGSSAGQEVAAGTPPASAPTTTSAGSAAEDPSEQPADSPADRSSFRDATETVAVVSPPTTAADPAPPAGQTAPPVSVPDADPDRWLWPTEGRVVARFDAANSSRNGVDIAGELGQAVRAAAPGLVVYSGNGLIGYGELVIVKHSERLLSAYAHNRRRLVQQGQQVSAGQHIADMGQNDRKQTLLHFEVREQGKPVDPLRFLPRR